jgi:hypothetical protein
MAAFDRGVRSTLVGSFGYWLGTVLLYPWKRGAGSRVSLESLDSFATASLSWFILLRSPPGRQLPRREYLR